MFRKGRVVIIMCVIFVCDVGCPASFLGFVALRRNLTTIIIDRLCKLR